MIKTTTNTKTETYTKPRIDVIEDHFELFIRCSGMDDNSIEKFLLSVRKHELKAVAIFIVEDECRVAEVEFEIDWEEHIELTHISGNIFDVDLPGWRDGVAPEAYVAVSRLVRAAKERDLKVSSWIIVSDEIRKNVEEHKRVCRELGYDYNGNVPRWKEKPREQTRQIEGLSEAKITSRQI